MKTLLFFLFIIIVGFFPLKTVFPQIAINSDGSAPDNSAMLDIKAADRGVLIPRISAEARNLIPSPATGLLIFNTTTNNFNYYNGTFWYETEKVFITSSIGTLSTEGGISINIQADIVAENSAILDINNPSRGLLIPRTIPTLIANPVVGLIIYDTAINSLSYFNGVQWVVLCSSSTGISGATGSQSSVGMAIKTDNTFPDPSAMLDVYSPNRGVLIPRLTSEQRNAIIPANGLMIFNTSSNSIQFYNGTDWYQLNSNGLQPPVAGIHVLSSTQITWKWNIVAGVAGYKWNTINDLSTAIDLGDSTVHSESGLSCETTYTRYVWAYNSCGFSAPAVYTQTSGTCFNCGSSLTVNHLAGDVAPVSKTVVYGTAIYIPGESSKCWITSNLGSDHQASAVGDATEESAGWYWQFNRKQGYKHDGTTRTPNSTWISTINEDFDWVAANDPCSTELGSTWHVPSYSEWFNLDATGNWTGKDGPWNSSLKLHSSGLLSSSAGSLSARGINGYYRSNKQGGLNTSCNLVVTAANSSMVSTVSKAYGITLRCVREFLPTVTTGAITNVSYFSMNCGGEVISPGGTDVTARGVCWGTQSNPTIAGNHSCDGSGIGVFVSSPVGLAGNTQYHVRAYATNSLGTAYGNELIFTTLWPCGSSLAVNHVAGSVAPVSKAITYGTTENIPGEPTKCWITSNLGADQQATAYNDASEASAGWYWQFNRKQGYKHDGITRTPSTTWITINNDNLDWQTSNDPCAFELGNGWRIPTRTEWENVDAAGNWNDWLGPWNSGLKLHASGYLDNADGSLIGRGSDGYYWSSANIPNNELLYDNGPMINSPGTGVGGADESILQSPLSNFGTSFNNFVNYRLADDFTVTGASWIVSSIEFYGYQTGSTTTSTFTAACCRIMNGVPGQPGTTVIWGDTVTNRLSATSFTNIYRVTSIGDSDRPIMKIVMNVPGFTLPAGNYWIEFSALGSLSSGPWCPYITINNQPVTGNALSYLGNGSYAIVNGTTYGGTYQQGIPFKIKGTQNGSGFGSAIGFTSGYCNVSSNNSANGMTLRCLKECTSAPAIPTAVSQVPTQTQIIWNWNTVSGANGYKWNTVNDYLTATDLSSATTKTETGLTMGTSFTRFVWAYNSCGNSSALILNQSTLPFYCGSSLPVNHLAGIVAPVSKSVIYGTVSNIPGETSKCWITSNLGADHQATSWYDETEASAGWYWQFNRTQGFKYDGTTRTPNTTWISSINENTDWQSSNDPCAIELSGGWRLPTFTEWNNLDVTGNWTSPSGPWNSGLKLHHAGLLEMANGALYHRGAGGFYQSSSQYSSTYGSFLNFGNQVCEMYYADKSYAYSIRCIKE